MEHIKPQVTHFSPEPIHEDKDIDVKAVLGFGIFLAVMGVFAALAMWGFYVGMDRWAEKRDAAAANPMTAGAANAGTPKPAAPRSENVQHEMKEIVSTFPEPRLQPDEVRDMDLFRQSEDKRLHSYGKVDASGQTIHIPIERAMEIVAERGLPNFGLAPAVPATRPATAPAPADTAAKKK